MTCTKKYNINAIHTRKYTYRYSNSNNICTYAEKTDIERFYFITQTTEK